VNRWAEIDVNSGGEKYATALEPATSSGGEPATPPPVMRIIEALLFASGQPIRAETAGEVIRGLSPAEFRANIEELNRSYRQQSRPYSVQSTPQGFILSLRPKYRAIRERLEGAPRETKLSRAAVDVLALIAFRQPIARSEIDSQRGHDSAAIVRQLVRLGLVVAEPPAAGQTESAYGTTPRFLELFGLQSLDDLPQTMDLQQI
jgi:segregation and condensation protein B